MNYERERNFLGFVEKEDQFEARYKTIECLLDRLGGIVYRGNKILWEEEMSELCDIAVSIVNYDPDSERIISDKKRFQAWRKLADILYRGVHKTESEEIFEKISNTLASVLKIADPQTNRGPADAIAQNLFDRWPWSNLKERPKRTKKTDKNEVVLKKYFDQFGLDAETAFKAWYASHEENRSVAEFPHRRFSHPVETALANMIEMRRLELRHPGGPKTLVDNFGVYCFSRYPEGMFDDQLDQIDDAAEPYGIIIAAGSDHNASHYTSKSISAYKSLWRQCTQLGINLRVIEVNTQREMRKRFFYLEEKYNIPGHQKAVFGIAVGHANEKIFVLGKDSLPLSHVTSEDVSSGNFAEDSKRFFAEGAHFVIHGCGAGEKGGLAEVASNVMPHLHILACPREISGISYHLTKLEGDNVPQVSVTYDSGMFVHRKPMSHYNKVNKTPVTA